MVWGAICTNGAAYIYRIKGKLNAANYQKMLEEEIFGQDLENFQKIASFNRIMLLYMLPICQWTTLKGKKSLSFHDHSSVTR
jgi:hypothetical protein